MTTTGHPSIQTTPFAEVGVSRGRVAGTIGLPQIVIRSAAITQEVMYGHGADIHSVAMVSDIRNFGHYLQATVQGGMALALGVAAARGRAWPRLVGGAAS